MPMYDYKCEECGTKFEVFHKSKEDKSNVVCPSCQSTSHRKLMSAGSFGYSSGTSSSAPSYPSGGGCASGMCGLNYN